MPSYFLFIILFPILADQTFFNFITEMSPLPYLMPRSPKVGYASLSLNPHQSRLLLVRLLRFLLALVLALEFQLQERFAPVIKSFTLSQQGFVHCFATTAFCC